MALNCTDCRTLRNCINLLSATRFSVISPLRRAAQTCVCQYVEVASGQCLSHRVRAGEEWGMELSTLVRPQSCRVAGWILLASSQPDEDCPLSGLWQRH